MRTVVLAGGYGGARFSIGLRDHLAADPGDHEVTVIANTADDVRLHGLYISPDLDTLMYTLGGGLDLERGWGRSDEAFRANEELAAHKMPGSWFGLGDRDLATHLIRTQMREAGYSLTQVTQALCERWNPGVRLLPMSDDRVETHAVVEVNGTTEAMHFQEWWIRHRAALPTRSFVQVGLEESRPTAEVRGAIAAADVIVLAPSNPVVSISPILAVPEMKAELLASSAQIIGVSPIIAGRPLRGMADTCLEIVDIPASASGIAEHYGARTEGGLLDAWVIDEQDAAQAAQIQSLGMACQPLQTVMHDPQEATRLAEEVLAVAAGASSDDH